MTATHRAGRRNIRQALRDLIRSRRADNRPGRHWADTVTTVGADYSPLAPAGRQALAPTYYATRALHAGPDEHTGVLTLPPDIDLSEVTK